MTTESSNDLLQHLKSGQDPDAEARAAVDRLVAVIEKRKPKVPPTIEHLIKAIEDGEALADVTETESRRLVDYQAKERRWRRFARKEMMDLLEGMRHFAMVSFARSLYGEEEARAISAFLDARTHVKPAARGDVLVEAVILALDLEEQASSPVSIIPSER